MLNSSGTREFILTFRTSPPGGKVLTVRGSVSKSLLGPVFRDIYFLFPSSGSTDSVESFLLLSPKSPLYRALLVLLRIESSGKVLES